jgi:lysophospholipase L1-like esterase
MNLLLRILEIVALFVLFSVWMEFVIRWWLRHRNQYYVWPPGLRLKLHPDREVFPELERVVRIEINRDGERGDKAPISGKGLYRILVAGGSPAECGLLDQPTSWPGLLQILLEKQEHLRFLGASKVHVGNIAKSGIASQHLDLIFERVLPQYPQLDTIIIMVGGNDVFGWLEYGAPASVQHSLDIELEAFSIRPGGQFSWKSRKLALVELFKILRHSPWRMKVRHNSGKWVERARTMRAGAKEIRTTVPFPAGMLDHFEYHFRSLLQKAKAHAHRVLVVRQPWFEKEYSSEEAAHFWHGGVGNPRRMKAISIYYSFEVVNSLMTSMDLRAAKVAEELKVEHLNLMPVLERSLKTYYDFVHFTPIGAKAVAEALVAAILRQQVSEGTLPQSIVPRVHHGTSFAPNA